MSDTANPAKLASAPLASPAEFDARLKRTDEDRWLASRYAAPDGRERLVAVYLLHQELQRTLQAREAMLGKIRLQWWRETLAQVGGDGPLRRHDLAEELARVMGGRHELVAAMQALVDRFDDILDDHLQSGGHDPGEDHEARHLASEGALATLAARALVDGADADELARVAAVAEAALARKAGLAGADARWEAARAAVRQVRAALWPAVLPHALQGMETATPLARRWRLFRSALLRRL